MLFAQAGREIALAQAHEQVEDHLAKPVDLRRARDRQASERIATAQQATSAQNIRELDCECVHGCGQFGFQHEHGGKRDGGTDIAQRIAKHIELGRGPRREHYKHVHVRGRAQSPLGGAAEQDDGAQIGCQCLLGEIDELLQVLGNVFRQTY